MMLFEYQNTEIPFMHVREQRAVDNAGILRDYITSLPPYMNPWYNKTKLPGLKSLKYDEHGTKIAIISSPDSESKAKDKLRGYTLLAALLDEYEYIQYIQHVVSGGAPAMISGREIARANGVRSCIIYISTPGDLETATGKASQKMIDMTPPFTEKMYDMTIEEIQEMFKGMVQNNGDEAIPVTTLYIEFNYRQLRKTDRWVQEQYKEAERSGDFAEYRRGVLLQRFRGSTGVTFRQEDLDYIQNHLREPDYDIFILKKYHLFVYEHPCVMTDLTSDTPYFDITIPYLIGIDVASGGDGDNTTLCIVHPYTLQVVGELISPYIGILDLMRIITVVAKLIPKAIFCPETNNIGKAIVDFVQESQLESRFYHDPQLDLTKNVTTGSPATLQKQKATNKKYIGLYVTPKVRTDMFALLIRLMRDYRHLINTKFLVKDILNLVRTKTGKIEAADGEHDDMVMAYLHVVYVLYYGYDLTRFGIDKTLCKYEKVLEVIDDYEKEISTEIVDNTLPYDHPTIYEEQLLSDITSQNEREFRHMGGDTDLYGYRRDQYNQRTTLDRNPVDHLSNADIAYFRELNSYN